MTGGAFGFVAAVAFPDLASSAGLYAIVGMGAVAAPVLSAPISTVMIMFELIGDLSVTVAAMIAIAVASILTHRVLGRSFFAWQLIRRGVSLEGGLARQLLLTVRARHIMSEDFQTVAEGASISEIRHLLRTAPHDHFFVTDDEGRYVGKISFADIRDVAFDTLVDTLINARDLIVIGILHHNRLLRVYNKALLSARAEAHDER